VILRKKKISSKRKGIKEEKKERDRKRERES